MTVEANYKLGLAIDIIEKNIQLPKKYEGKSVIDMVEEQEKLIKDFCALGFEREQFFYFSRKFVGIENPEKKDIIIK